MIQVLTISLWAHLFCGQWSRPGKVFGWLSDLAYNRLPEWVYTPLVGCAMCHAVWASLPFEVWNIWHNGIGIENLFSVLCASFGAHLLNDFEEIREKWKNS
jgi:hypothetical protein